MPSACSRAWRTLAHAGHSPRTERLGAELVERAADDRRDGRKLSDPQRAPLVASAEAG